MSDQLPLVSILVNCYNSEAYLKQALDSIYAQTYQNFEIILVDNCSVDKTAAIARSFDHRLVYVKTEKNVPLYAARNVGLAQVKGQYLCVLDSDDYWVADKLEKQLQIFKKQNIDILYSKFYSHLEAERNFSYAFKVLYLKLINFSDNFIFNQLVSKTELITRYNINFQTIMFKVSSLQHTQFDARLNLIGDLDYIYRLVWKQDLKVYYMNTQTAFSRIHQRQLSRKSDYRWVIESLKSFYKVSDQMSEQEQALYRKYFVKFYLSSHLLRQKKFTSAFCLKASYALSSLRFFMHFLKSFSSIVKG